MQLSVAAAFSALVVGCATPAEAESERESAAGSVVATIANMLPVDGCSYPVTIDGVDYAPDARTLAVIRDRIPAGETITVRIDYQLTGRTAQVECGWGVVRELPEIAVVFD
jgi:hypothetical protein